MQLEVSASVLTPFCKLRKLVEKLNRKNLPGSRQMDQYSYDQINVIIMISNILDERVDLGQIGGCGG